MGVRRIRATIGTDALVTCLQSDGAVQFMTAIHLPKSLRLIPGASNTNNVTPVITTTSSFENTLYDYSARSYTEISSFPSTLKVLMYSKIEIHLDYFRH